MAQIDDKKEAINKSIRYTCILALSFSQIGKVKKNIKKNVDACIKEI